MRYIYLIILIAYTSVIAQDFILKGKVVDRNSNLPIENVNVGASLFKGTVTDKDGKFSIKLKLGKYRIKIEQWQPGEKIIKVELVPRVIEFNPVEVEVRKVEYINYQKFTIQEKELKHFPSIRESDIFKSVFFCLVLAQ